MAFDRTCDDCGVTYTAMGNRSKFCPTCAKERERQARSAYRKRVQAKKQRNRQPPDAEKFFGDTAANILACLACTRTACMLDSQDTCSLLSARR